MAYSTQEEMLVRFGETRLVQVTDKSQPPTKQIDAERLEAALTGASELIDGYAAAKYRTPLTPTPDPVRVWCQDIAIYRLYSAIGLVPPDIRTAFEDALAGLKDMAKGLIVFQAEGVPTVNTPNGGILFGVPVRVMTPESLTGF